MKHKFAIGALAASLIVAVMTVSIPTVRAQIQQFFAVVVSTSGPIDPAAPMPPPFNPFGGDNESPTISGSSAIAGMAGTESENLAETPVSEEVYQKGDQFMVVTRTKLTGDATLPQGEAATVNGQPAALQTGLAGEYRQQLPATEGAMDQDGKPAQLPTPVVIQYTDANKLTWVASGVKYEVLSNLAVEPLLKAAAALPIYPVGSTILPTVVDSTELKAVPAQPPTQ